MDSKNYIFQCKEFKIGNTFFNTILFKDDQAIFSE
jgi:hypothetical protein